MSFSTLIVGFQLPAVWLAVTGGAICVVQSFIRDFDRENTGIAPRNYGIVSAYTKETHPVCDCQVRKVGRNTHSKT